jgi:hypothetical protein
MTIDTLLSRLEKVKKSGPDKHRAQCPSCKRDSALSVYESPDGRVLIHCFRTCSTGEILQSIGMGYADLFPTTASFHLPKIRRAFSAMDALIGLGSEALVLIQYANHLATGEVLTKDQYERLLLAAKRCMRAQEATQ